MNEGFVKNFTTIIESDRFAEAMKDFGFFGFIDEHVTDMIEKKITENRTMVEEVMGLSEHIGDLYAEGRIGLELKDNDVATQCFAHAADDVCRFAAVCFLMGAVNAFAYSGICSRLDKMKPGKTVQ